MIHSYKHTKILKKTASKIYFSLTGVPETLDLGFINIPVSLFKYSHNCIFHLRLCVLIELLTVLLMSEMIQLLESAGDKPHRSVTD